MVMLVQMDSVQECNVRMRNIIGSIVCNKAGFALVVQSEDGLLLFGLVH